MNYALKVKSNLTKKVLQKKEKNVVEEVKYRIFNKTSV